jgi:catechol 2,3-dioxygenase-like lactoylglutathione lyase family enzyme
MDWTLEVVIVPVSDLQRSVAFYRDQLGFHLDHDTTVAGARFAQLTPRGSGCSIVIGAVPGGAAMVPGTLRGLQLVVSDAHRAHDELRERGVVVRDITVVDERDGGTLFGFDDPDGNSWTVQQIRARADAPLIPR